MSFSDSEIWHFANTAAGTPSEEIYVKAGRRPAEEEPDRARCVECGRTVLLEAVYDCCQQGIASECGHSWFMYQFYGQYVLE